MEKLKAMDLPSISGNRVWGRCSTSLRTGDTGIPSPLPPPPSPPPPPTPASRPHQQHLYVGDVPKLVGPLRFLTVNKKNIKFQL
ncbi:hypothetical protein HanXRQr2_Chr16g0725241 [Helianthus annuus]|uniref:Uncharacterized protein n=1 Tax=Helianthus annuus TaxID=4232 RepID=A0A9K3GYC2_HELAN|nr:hypothetical protein HanXRQr2_Chr16g0725241 [Helianthus annuus]